MYMLLVSDVVRKLIDVHLGEWHAEYAANGEIVSPGLQNANIQQSAVTSFFGGRMCKCANIYCVRSNLPPEEFFKLFTRSFCLCIFFVNDQGHI